MRPYSQANRRPYPNRERAVNQAVRALREPECPACGHLVRKHAVEAGQRVCTRGYGRISCLECAHGYACMSRLGQQAVEEALRGMRMASRWVPEGLSTMRPVVLPSRD
ncbi:hypothetical protein [Streptomyces werraensis]|uniref:hypothetical protein n=1 Tax=Streptomyces werraensis TaxID=68284 RepID=UPI0037D63CD8